MKKIKYNLVFFFIAFFTGTLVLLTNRLTGTAKEGNPVFKIVSVLCVSCLAYFIPEVIAKISDKRIRSRKARELRFLKKLFVIRGSVKPADFIRVMKTLIPRSVYYRHFLEDILERHKKSNTNLEVFYYELLKETDDLELKLFCEKLNMAANYDFDKAIKSISDDFVREQRQYARFVKKKVELIHIIGVVGMFILITVILLWLLGPWLDMLSMESYVL